MATCCSWQFCGWFGPKPLLAVAAAGATVLRQVGWGAAIGLAVSIPAWIVVLNVAILAPFKEQLIRLAGRMDLHALNPLWMGVCAGVGEDCLARGALQPLRGIGWTSVLFTLAHYRTGSFASMTPTKWGYAAFVFLASVLMGYVQVELGLVAAAVAHSVVDVFSIVMLRSAQAQSMAGSG